MKKSITFLAMSFLLLINVQAQDAILASNDLLLSTTNSSEKEAIKPMDTEVKNIVASIQDLVKYPEKAEDFEMEGTVVLEIFFDGSIQRYSIRKSGTSVLDEAVMKGAKSFAKTFNESHQANRKLTSIFVPIKFKLN